MNKNFDFNHDYIRTSELFYKSTTTKCMYAAMEEISYPQLFEYLALDQKNALLQLQRFPSSIQQNILAEWQAGSQTQEICNSAIYLFGIIKKARITEFGPFEIHKEADN